MHNLDYTLSEIAALVRLHPNTVRNMARAGKIAGCYRFGHVWRVHREAFEALRNGGGR